MDVAILGGGVAGLSSAIALAKHGFHVRVYERQRVAATMGAGMVIWPNGTYVLDQLGLMADVVAVAGQPPAMQRWSSAGENLGAIDITLINRRMGYPSLAVLRRDLQQILLNKLTSLGVPVHYGHEVKRIETTASDQARVHFKNAVRLTADMIIGADGRMASTARQYVNGDNAPVYQGFINWVGVFESTRNIFNTLAVEDVWGVGARFGIVPVAGNKAYWAGAVASSDIGQRDPAQYKPQLRALFSDWPERVQAMIEGTPLRNINKIYVHDHHPVDIWHQHNVIMIGDAAHAPLPTSGQGACQALEDSWHLTQCLLQNRCNIAAAFAQFTARRLDKTTRIIHAARSFAEMLFHQDAQFCAERNNNSKSTDFVAAAAGMSALWAQHLPLAAGQSANVAQ